MTLYTVTADGRPIIHHTTSRKEAKKAAQSAKRANPLQIVQTITIRAHRGKKSTVIKNPQIRRIHIPRYGR